MGAQRPHKHKHEDLTYWFQGPIQGRCQKPRILMVFSSLFGPVLGKFGFCLPEHSTEVLLLLGCTSAWKFHALPQRSESASAKSLLSSELAPTTIFTAEQHVATTLENLKLRLRAALHEVMLSVVVVLLAPCVFFLIARHLPSTSTKEEPGLKFRQASRRVTFAQGSFWVSGCRMQQASQSSEVLSALRKSSRKPVRRARRGSTACCVTWEIL